MARLDDYIEAVTRRLRPDPELHWDIGREVRAHLEDAADEARGRGLSEGEALDAALEKFGDAEEVSEQLWQANRGRMRFRAVVKWACRAALLPGAIALGLVLLRFNWHLGTFVRASVESGDVTIPAAMEPLEPRAGLSEEERFVLEHLSAGVDGAEELVEAFPDGPILYANYVAMMSDAFSPDGSSPEKFKRLMAVLERGEAVEPDNALYDYTRAAYLMIRASTATKGEGFAYRYFEPRSGEVRETNGYGLVIEDRAMFERGVQQLLEGARKPYYRSHVDDVLRLRQGLLENPTTLGQQLQVVAMETAALFPAAHPFRQMVRRLPGYAVILGEEGRTQDAAQVAEAMVRAPLHMGAGACSVIGLMVAGRSLTAASGQAGAVYERLRMMQEAEEGRRKHAELLARFGPVWERAEGPWKENGFLRRHAGVLAAMLLPAWTTEAALPWIAAYRRAEHVALERFGLGMLAGALVLLIVLAGVVNSWQIWKWRGSDAAPKLLFVGWRRLGWVVLLALALPLALYWAYTRLSPLSAMRYGINYVFIRRIAEIGVGYALILLGLAAMGYRAVRRRCLDAGIQVERPRYMNPLLAPKGALVAALAACAVALAVGAIYDWTMHESFAFHPDLILGALLFLFPLLFILWRARHLGRGKPALALFRRTFLRSVLPILAAALLAVGLVSHAYLRHNEAQQVAWLNAPGHHFMDELEMTVHGDVRGYLRELDEQWNREHGIPRVEPATSPFMR